METDRMTIREIIQQLPQFSNKELEGLAHEIAVLLYERDGLHISAKKKRRHPSDPLTQLVQEAESWLKFAKRREVSPDSVYWANKILIARDKKRKLEQEAVELLKEEYATTELCVDEMVCQRCGHELDCFCGCPCLCHEMA
jgi:hypothetical protein